MEFNKKEPIIYIISGKSGSGKNTVADIIKKYYNDKSLEVIDTQFAYYLKDYAKRIIGWDGNEESKPRDFLQHIGVELIRNNINNRLVVDRTIDDIKVFSYFYDVITLSDARFVDEIEEVKKAFPNAIKVEVIGKNNKLNSEQNKHLTENALNNYHDYDYIIDNTGALEYLEDQVIKMIGDDK